MIDNLNKLSPTRIETLFEKYFPETKDDILHLATQQDCLVAGIGAQTSSFPELPQPQASIEIWLRTRPLEALFLEALAEWNVAHDFLREILPAEEAKLLADDLSVETVNGWSVIRIGVIE